jgi:prepilin signal peptidase PulO-like enzyme (type II secretory pathway)
LVIFVYDLKHYIIPDKIVYPAILIALLFNLLNYELRITNYELLNILLAALVASGFFLFLVLISQGKWMGLGDVKLAFLMGLVLGWPNILLALFLAFICGAIIGLALIIIGKKNIKSQIPFGPFLAGTTIFTMIYGQYLTNWVENMLYF